MELSDEMKEKLVECKTPEEVLSLAQEEGIELSDEQLEAVAGGSWGSSKTCDERCGRFDTC